MNDQAAIEVRHYPRNRKNVESPTELKIKVEEWYIHGERHRDGDKPALISFGDRMWYKNGRPHRLVTDGPAFIQYDGRVEWWEDGVRIR